MSAMSLFRRNIMMARKASTPITYLTQWKIVGNSEVHTDEYLTQWKVEGNSVVDNNTILSCGDLGQDGKYHVKIYNGATIYDIPLTEPLRKVNNVADSIEFVNGVATLTRLLKSVLIGNLTVVKSSTNTPGIWRWTLKVSAKNSTTNILNTKYSLNIRTYYCEEGINVDSGGNIQIFDSVYTSAGDAQAFKAANADIEIIYELATPTTELVDAPQISVSPTDTYTSANETPFSAFEHTENKEIWSCGEYSATDGKYHIVVLPLGKSPVDIALDEPLRKVNDVADLIEFPSDTEGKALVTRKLNNRTLTASSFNIASSKRFLVLYMTGAKRPEPSEVGNMMVAGLTTYSYNYLLNHYLDEDIHGVCISGTGNLCITDPLFLVDEQMTQAFRDFIEGKEAIYELATPTTELVDAPQIEEAESYTCVISQGGKAVEWSSFTTNPEGV